jgi:hypothetical protein
MTRFGRHLRRQYPDAGDALAVGADDVLLARGVQEDRPRDPVGEQPIAGDVVAHASVLRDTPSAAAWR